MRVLRLLQVIVLLSFITPHTLSAGPITGDTAAAPASTSEGDGDDSSNPDARARGTNQPAFEFASLFDALGPMIRVAAPIYLAMAAPQAGGGGGDSGGGDAFGGGGDAFGGVVSGESPSLANVSFQSAVGNAPALPPGLIIPNVPEPATFALMVPGALFVARRVLRSRRGGR
jgi:hypothetical protein